jgi:dephospho-CoA kinase
MLLIGLTGGIASGKSVVSARLGERGAIVVDADLLAREVVEPGTPSLELIERAFGLSVIAKDGSLDRQALGAIVFADPEARSVLNGITHPAVWARAVSLIEAAQEGDPDAVVVYDVPLLVEASASRPISFDLIVVTDADRETRIQRLVSLRGMTREEAVHRVNSQASDAERLAIADVVIDTNGTISQTIGQADALWESLPQRTRTKTVGGSA